MSGIRREYEFDLGPHHYEVEVWISEDRDGLRFELERIVQCGDIRQTFDPKTELLATEPIEAAVGRQVELERESIRAELDQAAYDQAVDAKISERKEGGN